MRRIVMMRRDRDDRCGMSRHSRLHLPGATEDEALANITGAIQGCLEARSANGMPLTAAAREIEVTV
jgi:hypothetical protein